MPSHATGDAAWGVYTEAGCVGVGAEEGQSLSRSATAKARIASLLPSHRRSASLPGRSSGGSSAASLRAARHWDLVRMHFIEYPRQARALTAARWAGLVAEAVEAAREQCHRRHAAELLLRTGLFGGTPPASRAPSRAPSLGPWQPASWDSLMVAAADAAAAAAAEPGSPAAPSGQPLLPGSRAPSGQPLVSPFGSASRSSSPESSRSSSSEPFYRGAIPRTVSRRQLFVPQQPLAAHLSGVLESPAEANPKQSGGAQKISDEWLAYEQHRAAQRMSQDILRNSLGAALQQPALHG